MSRFVFQALAGSAAFILIGMGVSHAGKAFSVPSPPRSQSAGPALATRHAPAETQATPVSALQTDWSRLSRYPSLIHSSVSAYAYDLTTHQVLAAVNPALEVTPGSVTKLFTSVAALNELGPNFTYKTLVMGSTQTPSQPIYLVGSGDPWLEANGRSDLEGLAARTASQVKSATRVVGISSLFAPPLYGIGWPIGGLAQNYSAGTSALMAERSEIGVLVIGAPLVGDRPRVVLKFDGTAVAPHYFTVVNRATTVVTGTPQSLLVTRVLGTNRIVISGRIPENAASGPWPISVHNPAQFAATLFQSALAKDGVHFSGPAATAPTLPSGLAVLASYTSPPLSTELGEQNQYSINQMAENLFRELSAHQDGIGTLTASQKIMSTLTASIGVDPGRVQVDGSGLSPLDQMSARQVVELLTYASQQPWFPTLQNSLIHINDPTACGFLCPPSWHLSLLGHAALWVKPGNLSNQWNLAGYAKATNGNLIAFAILDDGTPTSANTTLNSPVSKMLVAAADWPQVAMAPPAVGPSATAGAVPPPVASLIRHIPGQQSGTSVSVAVLDADTGRLVYQSRGAILMRAGLAPRIPLDVAALKLLPARLPPVEVKLSGTVQAGVLHGSLVLIGNNNTLTVNQMARLAEAIHARGIDQVTGSVDYVNPTSGYQIGRWPGGLPWEDLGQSWAPPSTPLALDQDVASLHLRATRAGSPPAVSLIPQATPIHILNRIQVIAGRPSTAIAITLQPNSDLFVLTGTMPAGTSVTERIAPPDPGLMAASVLRRDLMGDGVAMGQPGRVLQAAPAGPVILPADSNSVASVVASTLSSPSLQAPNQLLRDLGPQAARDAQALLGAAPSSVGDWTGAGIGNYLTAEGVAHALLLAYHTPQDAPLVHDLATRLFETASPEQYEALGYVKGPGHPPWVVVILAQSTHYTGSLTPTILSP